MTKTSVWMILASLLRMRPSLIYNACQLELAGIFMLENAKLSINICKLFNICEHLNYVRLPFESNHMAYTVRITIAFYSVS